MSDAPTPPAARPPERQPGRAPAGRAPGGGGGGRGALPTGDQQTTLGALLIGLAVVIGLVLLVKGFGDEGGGGEVVQQGPTADDIDRDAAPTVDPSEQTTTTVRLRPNEQVTVLVANASGATGAAGRVAEVLTADGYTIVGTSNAPATSSDQVLYSGDLQAEAEALAEALGLDADVVGELPDPPPLDVKGAQVLVMVGPNLASADLGGTATSTIAGGTTSSTARATTSTTAG